MISTPFVLYIVSASPCELITSGSNLHAFHKSRLNSESITITAQSWEPNHAMSCDNQISSSISWIMRSNSTVVEVIQMRMIAINWIWSAYSRLTKQGYGRCERETSNGWHCFQFFTTSSSCTSSSSSACGGCWTGVVCEVVIAGSVTCTADSIDVACGDTIATIDSLLTSSNICSCSPVVAAVGCVVVAVATITNGGTSWIVVATIIIAICGISTSISVVCGIVSVTVCTTVRDHKSVGGVKGGRVEAITCIPSIRVGGCGSGWGNRGSGLSMYC